MTQFPTDTACTNVGISPSPGCFLQAPAYVIGFSQNADSIYIGQAQIYPTQKSRHWAGSMMNKNESSANYTAILKNLLYKLASQNDSATMHWPDTTLLTNLNVGKYSSQKASYNNNHSRYKIFSSHILSIL